MQIIQIEYTVYLISNPQSSSKSVFSVVTIFFLVKSLCWGANIFALV